MKKVIAFGTFDIFHPGHISNLKQARKLGDYLVVVVARDHNTLKQKGQLPRNSEKKRSAAIRKAKIADKVILGSKTNNYFQTLRTYKIDLIALGYDQRPTIPQLKKALKKHRLAKVEIKRLKSYNPNKYKSSKLLNLNVK
jgi:FAD synthetase